VRVADVGALFVCVAVCAGNEIGDDAMEAINEALKKNKKAASSAAVLASGAV